MPPTTITDAIAAASARLTPAERRIAAAVVAEPTLLAFGTVSDLAAAVATSRPTIVRFAVKLGFDGYADLQDFVRTGLSLELSRPSERIRAQDGTTSPTRAALESAVALAFDAVAGHRLASLADPVVAADTVWILSGETSRAGAHVLHSGLSMIRPAVHLVEDQSAARDLSSASPGDVAVVFDFRRYRTSAFTASQALAKLGVTIVAVTDGPLSPLAGLASQWCAVKVPAAGPFDSSVPAVVVAELMVAHVAQQLRDDAREHIDRVEELWAATGTFLNTD